MKHSFPAWLVIFSLLVISCSSSTTGTTENKPDEQQPDKGKVIPDVSCVKDPLIRYSLYLPNDYSFQKKYPVILAFDPQASGLLPVEKYDSLAEHYGYILIGSKNSKNGLPMNETEKIVNSMLAEIRTRYSADSARIYLMGFSGGARIASLVALYGGGIKGVIGCGAGFPGTTQPGRYRFDYIGFAGNADFNMNEMVSLDEQLETANFRHALFIFDGKHEWPPAETMEYAFLWNEFCVMKDRKDAGSMNKTADLQAKINEELQKAQDQKSPYRKKLALQQQIRFEQGLVSVDQEKKEVALLVSGQEYRNEEKKIISIRDKERQEQEMFTKNFFLKDLNWWKGKITDYGLRITNGKDREEVLMYKRIMSYLSLLAYMNYTHAGSSGDKQKADFALEVYRIVDPENAAKIK